MKASLTARVGLLAVWSSLVPGLFVAGWTLATCTQTVFAQEEDQDPKQLAEELLRRARQAMADGDLEIADSLLSRAEAYNIRYGVLHLGDTPKKARRDLDRMRKSKRTGGSEPERPSDRGTEAASDAETEAAAQLGEAFGATGEQAPPAETSDGRRSPSPSLNDPNSKARRYLANARREMGRSNLAAAEHWYRQAVQLPASYGPEEDSPEKLLADLEQAGRRVAPVQAAPEAPFGTTAQAPPPVGAADVSAAMEALSEFEPASAGLDEAASPFGRPAPTAPPEGDEDLSPAVRSLAAGSRPVDDPQVRQASDEFIVASRMALAQGEFDQASQLLTQAMALGVRYEAQHDSPQKVQASLRAGQQLAQQFEAGRDDAGVRRAQAAWLLEQAEWLARWQQFAAAEQLAQNAQQLGVEFGAFDLTPEHVLDRIAAAQRRPGADRRPVAAGNRAPAASTAATGSALNPTADQAIFQGEAAGPGVIPAQALAGPGLGSSPVLPAVAQGNEPTLAEPTSGDEVFPEPTPEPLPSQPRTLPEASADLAGEGVAPPAGSLLEGATAEQQIALRRMQSEIISRESTAKALLATNPQQAAEQVESLRAEIEAAELPEPAKVNFLRHIDRTLAEFARYVEENRARIDLNAQNQQVLDEVERGRQMKIEVDEKLAKLVDDFNQLMDEQRYAEAELLAQRAEELDPENTVVRQLKWQSRFVRRYQNALRLADNKERGVVDALAAVEESSTPFDDRRPMVFDARRWEDLVKKRKGVQAGESTLRTEQEREIDQKLRTPVSVQFEDRPLGEVLGHLAQLVDLNIWADPAGLSEEAVTTDTPITINLPKEIQLRSALKLILEPLHLDYVIENEVLKITSQQFRSGNLISQTYYVADLVTPIPNFTPNSSMGLPGAIREGFSTTAGAAMGMGGLNGGPPMAVLASRDGSPNSAMIDSHVLANMGAGAGLPGASAEGIGPQGFGPGGLGGGAFADFDSLIDMITSTVAPTTWDEVGGPGTIQEWRNQLSLVISQTQEVHEEIVDLLEQLRRLQDLQVTIEVRFITLNDNFFERIGVDFDFDINDNIDKPFQIFGQPTGQVVGNVPVRNTQDRDLTRSQGVTVGLQPTGLFSTDLDIPVRQGSFQLAVPQFGGFDPSAGVQMGFAILSDLEAFFLINAAQGDRRSNVLQAPKVTLFNGQQASVADISQSPFVISVIPVVGDFAAAQQPVIVVLNEGTFLTVQAVVSSDRRYVRLTVVPFFSSIGEVNTFTFAGSSTTTEESSSAGEEDDTTERANRTTTTSEGTTVQLPTFSLVTVSTTVSVPDGGTVLLGGIKRLSEGRNEFGVPMLNKIPYINRLFKNVGIGRETQSLMMMVTPRIIIPEEEEEAILGTPVGP